MTEVTPRLRKIIDQQETSLQRIAMRIIDLPEEQRETAFSRAHKEFEQGIADHPNPKWGTAWVDILMQRLRSRVLSMEPGGGRDGRA
jgi:hypothetical protein